MRSLERLGVSMVVIEDKTGLKKNSLFGTEAVQMQDSIENFSEKIKAGKKAQRTREFMICARIESLILEREIEDALMRTFAFSEAGADAIMIHSRRKDPGEIRKFIEKIRGKDKVTSIVLVPTSFNSIKGGELRSPRSWIPPCHRQGARGLYAEFRRGEHHQSGSQPAQ